MPMNILVTYSTLSSSITVGVTSPLDYIRKKYNVRYLLLQSNSIVDAMVRQSDFVIIARGADITDLTVLEMCKKYHKYVFYYIDDDLLNLNDYVSINNRKFYEKPGVKENILKIMRGSHCLWAVNPYLRNKYSKYFEDSFVTKAPALLLDEGDINLITNKEEDVIRIGFAGGIDYRDFFEEMLKQPFKNLLYLYGDKIKYEIFGFMPYRMYDVPIDYIPYTTDFNHYIHIMTTRQWDIGLAPLPFGEFQRCKYHNKFLEYGALKIPGLYSNVEPFSHVIRHEENGLLVENTPISWQQAIEYLIKNRDVSKTISHEAYNQVKENNGVQMVAEEIYNHFIKRVK